MRPERRLSTICQAAKASGAAPAAASVSAIAPGPGPGPTRSCPLNVPLR